MGREAQVNEKQVFQVADALVKEGLKPTSRDVRARLGTGSMGTILRILQKWQASQAETSTNLVLPASLQKAAFDFVAQEVSVAKASLETRLAEQQAEMTALMNENGWQAEEIASLHALIDGLTAEFGRLQGRAVLLESELRHAREETERVCGRRCGFEPLARIWLSQRT